MQKHSPTFLQIISTDYLAQNFFVLIFAGWVVYAIDAVFHGTAAFPLFIFSVICTLAGMVLSFGDMDSSFPHSQMELKSQAQSLR